MQDKWPREKALGLRTILDKMQLCGCGNNTQWECLLELLEEAETHTASGFYRDKWFEFAAKVLDSWNLIEHGTSIGFAWPTADGKLLLEFLRDFGTDDAEFPDWCMEFSWDADPDEKDTYAVWVFSLEG
jgi:hypothetical protein